jgi:hypothetical protein
MAVLTMVGGLAVVGALVLVGLAAGLIAAGTADRYPSTKQTRGDAYRATTEAFMATYQESLNRRGLRLRPGVTLE